MQDLHFLQIWPWLPKNTTKEDTEHKMYIHLRSVVFIIVRIIYYIVSKYET